MVGRSNEDLFGAPEPAHPRLRRWRQLIVDYPLARLEVRRKWDGLTYAPARMFVSFRKAPGDSGVLEEALWEDELNQGLVEMGVAAIDKENEATRYALALRSAIEPVSLRHGQDYARSVLVCDLREREIGQHPRLSPTLHEAHVNRPSRSGDLDQARDAVDGVLGSKARELVDHLKYSRADAESILASALAAYLDEIFHIRARANWFGGRKPKVR